MVPGVSGPVVGKNGEMYALNNDTRMPCRVVESVCSPLERPPAYPSLLVFEEGKLQAFAGGQVFRYVGSP